MTVVLRSPQNACATLHHGGGNREVPTAAVDNKRVGAVGLQDIKKRLMAGASPFDEPCQLGCALPAVIAVRQMAWNRQ